MNLFFLNSITLVVIHFRSADFGYIPYGKIMSGDLALSTESRSIGCVAHFDKSIKDKFLVTRIGDCSILQKAFVAQDSGASLLIVVADHDLIDEIHMLNPGYGKSFWSSINEIIIENSIRQNKNPCPPIFKDRWRENDY